MNPKRIIISLTIIVAIGVLVYLRPKSNDGTTVAATQQGKPSAMSVSAYCVKPETLDNKVNVTGTLLANQEVELRSEVSGKIVQLPLKEGARVTKGELLVKINDADLQAQLKKLKFEEQVAADKDFRQKKLLDINGISQEDYNVTSSQLSGVKADIELTQAQIAKTEIRAPFDGIIGLKSVSEGSYITPLLVIATIQDIDPIKIDFSVPEKYQNEVRAGDIILFQTEGSTETYQGSIYAVEPKVDLATRTISLRAIYNNREDKIFPGSFAHIELVLKQITNAILVPTEAIIPELKGQKVFLSKNGVVFPVKVETGIRTDAGIQITKGLSIGDTVITTGVMQLKPGTPVKIADMN